MKIKDMKEIPKPKKKISKTYLRKKADTLFSQFIRKRGKCELQNRDHIVCKGVLQAMHVIGRKNMRLRFDPKNMFSGCQAHHYWYTRNPLEFYEMVRREFPIIYKYIMKVRHELIKVDYQNIIKMYT